MNMTNLKLFNFENQSIRIIDKNDNLWFVLADVCRILDLTNPSMVKTRLKEDGLSLIEAIDSIGRLQRVTIINHRNI